ncbi:MAG: carbamoyl-phosphate synthase large subunit, partial [Actinobacteria bacterium]|nr:carbamoyl-phosphate synthase large subunit [Actinomycetota bacterium]
MSFAGILISGGVSVSMNSWWTEDETDYALRDSGAKVLICDDQRFENARKTCAELGIHVLLVRSELPSSAGHDRWETALELGTAAPAVEIVPDDDATILYTSGTTGRPKGAVSTHRAVISALMAFSARQAIEGVRATEKPEPDPFPPSFILIVPLFHVTGCVAVLMSCFVAGLKLVIMYKWDAGKALEIIEREKPDAVLPTLGGQTALNLAMALHAAGVVGHPGTPELIGANAEAIATAEDRDKFKQAMIEIGLSVPRSGIAHSMAEADTVLAEIGLPVIIRPAYILGGRGTGIAHTKEQFVSVVSNGLSASPINEVLIESSIAGWKEYELEVMRDRADNCVIICSIENVDPMGVHTGDSITVAPAMTLSDVEYQQMRDAAFACIRRVGVETGGSNVQFAVNPETGEQVVIEMNPRVSRSSALASKATGFPIAKIAAKLAVGYTLDEISNDITKKTPASFEPTIDYVVTKVPRWAFEKFPGTPGVLGTQMQSVGESMAIGRTFTESLQKALRSLENGHLGLNCDPSEDVYRSRSDDEMLAMITVPTPERLFQVGECLRRGIALETVYDACKIDPWFLDQMSMIIEERH